MAISKFEMNRRYRESHREQLRVKANQYHQLHKTDSEYIKKRQDYWWSKHTRRILLTDEQKNKNARMSKKNYSKNNPMKLLLSSYKYYDKKAKKFNCSGNSYRWHLYTWWKLIKKLGNNTCQICDKPAEHAHHIFPKAQFPELTFNLNNGIALCIEHHREIHRRSW